MTEPLWAVSPLDGRYAGRTAPLREYASEAALMRARARVEVEYLIALAELEATPVAIDEGEAGRLRSLYEEFDDADAQVIKAIETDGHGDVPATNHDVKAIEYWLREHADERLHPWIHFGLTSEDVNNLAYRLLVRGAIENVLRPAIAEVRAELATLAERHRDLPMLAHTHGQPATPTTFGKEMAVYAARLDRTAGELDRAVRELSGKLAGASGTYAAHAAAYPAVDWPAFAREFVDGLGLEHVPLTTQVNPCDDLAAVFDACCRVNGVLVDLARDAWLYVSKRYLGQRASEGEVGSSTMPHKVNPIDFENAEGNLSKATSDLRFLAEYVTSSRLQRDLSDSTVKRNIGSAFAYSLLGATKTRDGLRSVTPNEAVTARDLEETPAVLAEAIQTVLRREGDPDAYERLKDLTRGAEELTVEDVRAFVDELDVDESVREELRALEPATYVGVADALVDELE